MAIDPAVEAAFEAEVGKVSNEAVQQLRDTLRPNFNPRELGYESVEHARLMIIQTVDRQINRMCAAHLKKVGK